MATKKSSAGAKRKPRKKSTGSVARDFGSRGGDAYATAIMAAEDGYEGESFGGPQWRALHFHTGGKVREVLTVVFDAKELARDWDGWKRARGPVRPGQKSKVFTGVRPWTLASMEKALGKRLLEVFGMVEGRTKGVADGPTSTRPITDKDRERVDTVCKLVQTIIVAKTSKQDRHVAAADLETLAPDVLPAAMAKAGSVVRGKGIMAAEALVADVWKWKPDKLRKRR